MLKESQIKLKDIGIYHFQIIKNCQEKEINLNEIWTRDWTRSNNKYIVNNFSLVTSFLKPVSYSIIRWEYLIFETIKKKKNIYKYYKISYDEIAYWF